MKRIIVVWIVICLFCAACLSALGEEIWLDDDSAYEVFEDDDESQFIDDEDTFDDDEDEFEFTDDEDEFEFIDDDDGFEFFDDDDENGKAEDDDFVLNLDDVKVGDIITIGRYPQNDDDPEPIEWIVLQKDGKRAFLLSRYVLDAIPYEESHDKVTWEECTLRAWLNDDFYYDSFSSAERAYIIETQINEQTDYIYLMNRSEAMVNYLHSSFPVWRRGIPTQRAIDNGVYTENGNCAWWLRTRGRTNSISWVYGSGKEISSKGNRAHKTANGVRPCMWVLGD